MSPVTQSRSRTALPVLCALTAALVVGAPGCKEEKRLRYGTFCETISECPAGQLCQAGQCFSVCETSLNCEGQTVCGFNGTCVEECKTSDDCPAVPEASRICVEGRCEVVEAPGFVTVDPEVATVEGAVVEIEAGTVVLSDPDSGVVEWKQTGSIPEGVSVELNAAEPKADSVVGTGIRFAVPVVHQQTRLLFEVVVRDSANRTWSRPFEVVVENSVNELPTVGLETTEYSVREGETIVLDARSASDPNGDALEFAWTATGGSPTISDMAEAEERPWSRVEIGLPAVAVNTNMVVTVTVSDGTSSSEASASVMILANECDPGDDAVCDDANACTTDVCGPEGECTWTPVAGPCDDGDACTVDDSCAEGSCVSGAAPDCEDGNPCTKNDCDPAQGCTTKPADGEPCDDKNACTTGDQCLSESCVGGPPPECSDGNVCTTDSCDPTSGCTYTPKPGPCSDGDPCTLVDACIDGQCAAGGLVDCGDGNPCTDDFCGPEGCQHEPNKQPCDDQSVCTLIDECTGGKCVGVAPLDCDDGNACTVDSCSPATGCYHEEAHTIPCDDDNACTSFDVCLDGECVGGIPKFCEDGDDCNEGYCDPESGACVYLPDDSECDDDNPCTAEFCEPGGCVYLPLAGPCGEENACFQSECVLPPTSEVTCEELGWGKGAGSDFVCGASEGMLNGTCSGPMPFEEAQAFCQSMGARLCSANELLKDEVKGTGCSYDDARVWSSTPCELGFLTAPGGSGTEMPLVCRPTFEPTVARCCADSGKGAGLPVCRATTETVSFCEPTDGCWSAGCDPEVGCVSNCGRGECCNPANLSFGYCPDDACSACTSEQIGDGICWEWFSPSCLDCATGEYEGETASPSGCDPDGVWNCPAACGCK